MKAKTKTRNNNNVPTCYVYEVLQQKLDSSHYTSNVMGITQVDLFQRVFVKHEHQDITDDPPHPTPIILCKSK